MANLIFPSRLTQQPQGPVEIDRSNSLTRGLVFVANPAVMFSPLNGLALARTIRPTVFGIGQSCSSGVANFQFADNDLTKQFNGATTATVYSLIRRVGSVSGRGFHRATGGPRGISLYWGAFSPGPWLQLGPEADFTTRDIQYTCQSSFQGQFSFCAVWNGADSFTGYSNGQVLAAPTLSGTALTTLGTANVNPTVGAAGSDGGGEVGLSLAWNRPLTESESLELTRNPWQIFRKRHQILYFDAATGGATDLTIADSTHGHAAENAVLTSSHLLTVADATHAHSADNVALAQNSTIIVLDSTHAHTAEVSTVTETSSAPLTVLDSTHGHTAEVVAISTQTSVTVLDATHGHTADVVVTNTQTTAVVQDSTHGHTADTVGVTQQSEDETALTVLDSTHGHTAETVTLTTATSLIVLDSTHGHTAETSTVAQQGETSLTALDATHAHAADNARLTLSADQVAPATGGGGGWPFQVPYLKSELEKLDKKSAKRKTEKAKLPKPVRDSLLEAIAQTLPEPIKAPEPVIAIRPTEVAKPAPVAIKQPPAQDLSADIAQLAKSIQIMQGQIMELTQATIAMQLQLQEGLENIEALTLIGATIGDL